MWMAWLSRRLPPLLSRCRLVWPEEAGIGAVPLRREKRALLGMRRMSPTSPMMLAAPRWPIPMSRVSPVPIHVPDHERGVLEVGVDLVS